jgi:hypothetical protein
MGNAMALFARRKAKLALALLLALGAAALAELPWCWAPRSSPPRSLVSASSTEPWRAGAAEVEVHLPYPVTVAGYPPPRPRASGAALPLKARALVLESGGVRVGVVSVELLTLPEGLRARIEDGTRSLGLQGLWCAATHTHSSSGGYDPNLLSSLAGTGLFRPSVRDAWAAAAVQALLEAGRQLTPVAVSAGRGELGRRVISRNELPEVDSRIDRVVFLKAGRPLAQLVLLAAHPTLAPRPPPGLDGDYPSALATLAESQGQGLTLVLQGAVGNASFDRVRIEKQDRASQEVAQDLLDVLGKTPLHDVGTGLSYSAVEVALPAPDASRLVAPWARRPADNFLCANAPKHAEVSVLGLGSLRWVALPGEVTAQASGGIERAARAERVVGLVNGYLGYVEAPGRVEVGSGESQRQYFGPALASVLEQGARAAAR